MADQRRASQLVADFFTGSYRVSGSVDVRALRLADQLEDRTSSFVQLADAYVSNLERPAEIVASHTRAILRKERIVAALVAREEDGLSRQHTYGSYRGGYLQRAFLIIPAFEVKGYLRLSGRRDLRSVVTEGNQFVPLVDAQMSLSARPDVAFSGGLILVNRDHVEVMWEEEGTDG